MSGLPKDDDALVKLELIIGTRNACSSAKVKRLRAVGEALDPGLFPMAKSKWRRGVQLHIYPAPLMTSRRSAYWRAGDIRKLLANPPSFAYSTKRADDGASTGAGAAA